MATGEHGEAAEAAVVDPAGDEAGPFGVGHSDEKARQILDGAREVFLRDGFDGASMNDIARAAGVSKGTLYAYFESKEQLFVALIRHDKRQQAERACLWGERGGETPAETLRRIGRTVLDTMTRPEHVALVRTVMAAAPKFPAVGRAFYDSGPKYGTARFAVLLDRFVASGDLVVPDTRLAALQFLNLCQADLFRRLMFCVEDEENGASAQTAVDSAVEVFLKAYGRT